MIVTCHKQSNNKCLVAIAQSYNGMLDNNSAFCEVTMVRDTHLGLKYGIHCVNFSFCVMTNIGLLLFNNKRLIGKNKMSSMVLFKMLF